MGVAAMEALAVMVYTSNLGATAAMAATAALMERRAPKAFLVLLARSVSAANNCVCFVAKS